MSELKPAHLFPPLFRVLYTMEGEGNERVTPRQIMLAIRLDPIQSVSTEIA
jgi:hypothetical protein